MTKNISYSEIVKQTHTLIAGTTGSGKSVLINGLISEMLTDDCKLVLIDLKRVELNAYRHIKQTISYSDNISSALSALDKVISEMDRRYKVMQFCHAKEFTTNPVYVIVDELADLMTVDKKHVLPLLQRIGQIGRAANVHLICATQCPLVSVIPTSLKVNFTCIIGLKTRSAQDSRNILGMTGCESLPMYGYGYVLIPGKDIELYSIPYISDNVISAKVKPFNKGFVERYAVAVVAACFLLKFVLWII